MSSNAQVFDEVVITPGENPAHRIIQNVMDNKKQNDPLRNNSFEYDSYSKLYLTGELPEGVNRDTITDTTMINAFELLDRQYLFLTETEATRTFNPPNYDKEVVTAYNVSGFKDPMFATFVNQFQSFSFYDNNFVLNQKEYINPIAPGGLRRYLFILEDTLFHKETQDTTYTIKFRPRKGKNFEGVEGYLYIHSKEWAIERVIASPHNQPGSLVSPRIIQEYEITNGKKWFPKKISTELDFAIDFNGYVNIIGRSSLYIKNVQFDIESKKGFNPVSVEVQEDALADSSSINEIRGNTYTGKEGRTYAKVDSVVEENNLDRLLDVFKIASTGKIPIGVFSVPVQEIVYFNRQEGVRLGLGLETNRRLSKIFQIGGYFAYGLRDHKWKWGGDLNFTLNQARLIRLNLHYSDDVYERGSTDMYDDNFNLVNQGIYRDFFINLMDRQRFAGVNLSGLIRQNMKLQLFGNYKRFTFVDDYQYTPLFTSNGTAEQFDIAEVGFIFNWNIREKVMMLENNRVSLGTKWPKLTLKATRGLGGVFESNYDYYRLKFTVHQTFKIRGAGSISLVSKSGLTIGNVPLTLSHVQEGTGINFLLSVANTFETMQPAEFFSDQQSSLFFRYTFLPIKTGEDWTEPTFVIHSAAAFGTMKNRVDHTGFSFKTPEKGYYESGLIVDRLIVSNNILGLGAGMFYRYGPYELPKTKDNFFYKVSVRLNF
ncbi:hypothetical protein CW751_02895 [Brumimicrobium salinarum]|uniref:Carboxypeptidase-like regulatory domain-containing protein n=1 Tax=Brumimicrobium salinarum TaxID=2058658 RepID=A0A2I0R6U6_9FLAO|nr:DUF5686 family protein [Brumimicrobium salinarum]PKR82295.1 hypothetical protein CW751_02895 [Brumimicrobium salinarum]